MSPRAHRFVPAIYLLSVACGATPDTNTYALVPPASSMVGPARDIAGCAVLTIDDLSVEAAYDDERMVYRPAPYRLEYYNYHRWSAPPSLALADFLRDAFTDSGLFQRVTRDRTPATTLVLTGRLSALEEVDETRDRWLGRIDLEIYVEDPRTDEVLWSRRFVIDEPLDRQHPAALARALSRALTQIVKESTPEIATVADQAYRASLDAGGPASGPMCGSGDPLRASRIQ